MQATSLLLQPPTLTIRVDPHDVRDQADRLHAEDQEPRRVELPPLQVVPGRRREGVVVPVPGFAERREGEPPDIPRFVVEIEGTRAEVVADGVDRARGVRGYEQSDQSPPEE